MSLIPKFPDSKKAGLDKVSDLLVYQGKVSEEQVRLALETQKNNPRQDLGKILLSLGFISGADLAQAQAQRLGLDFVELTEGDFDRDVVALVPERVLRKHGAIPLRISCSRHLVVAMSDPSNLYALEDLRIISGYQITPVVAPEDEIRNLQAKLFATGERITKILEEAAGKPAWKRLRLGPRDRRRPRREADNPPCQFRSAARGRRRRLGYPYRAPGARGDGPFQGGRSPEGGDVLFLPSSSTA